MSGPEVAKTPGGGAPEKEGKEPVANGHAGENNDANPFAEYMWMENEEEYNRQVHVTKMDTLTPEGPTHSFFFFFFFSVHPVLLLLLFLFLNLTILQSLHS